MSGSDLIQVVGTQDELGWSDRSEAPIFAGGAVLARPAAAVQESVRRMAGSAVQASIVRFDAGAHTLWHTHDGDQILIITEGRGHIGTLASDHVVQVGDIIVIPTGVMHYHGATQDEPMGHLTTLFGTNTTVEDKPLEWPPPLSRGIR